jgi:ATP-binding cassette subfamily C protein
MLMGLNATRGELRTALAPFRSALYPILAISAVLNVLLLSGSFFMLLVYDNVLASRSGATLLGLLFIVTIAYAFQAALELVRNRAMIQIGAMIDNQLVGRIHDVLSNYELRFGPMRDGMMPVRDLEAVRNYMSGQGPLALLDLPYVLLFLGILILFHWSLGLLAFAGVLILLCLMIATDRMTKEPAGLATALGNARYSLAETTRRSAETIRALGMGARNQVSWNEVSQNALAAHDQVAEVGGRMQAMSRSFRLLLQSLTLALGAYLVISGRATGGVIIASSILSSRVLMPVEQTIGNWKGMTAARQAWDRLTRVLADIPEQASPLALPPPSASLEVAGLTSGPPGGKALTISGVNFQLKAGKALAIMGPSGSGKSTLARCLVGVWPILRGHVRLDGASLDQWDPNQLGQHIGYVPQAIDLFDGSIAQNIARFEGDADTDTIIAAARAADIHDFIVRLPEGYQYQLGPNGGNLSAGQRQRVALARALYKNPFLLVLDEPNSNLDAEGEAALGKAITNARERGAIVIVIAHRPSILNQVDHIMLLVDGQVRQLGDRDEMIAKLNLLPRPTDTGQLPNAAGR